MPKSGVNCPPPSGDELVAVLQEQVGGEDAFLFQPGVLAGIRAVDLVERDVAEDGQPWRETKRRC